MKCYSGTIVYSDLFSKGKSTSLFSRGKDSLDENSNVKISFVAVGHGNDKGVISDRLTKVSSLVKSLKKEETLHLDYASSKELAAKILSSLSNQHPSHFCLHQCPRKTPRNKNHGKCKHERK